MTEPLVFGRKVRRMGYIICGSWNNANFISDEYESSFELKPYTYKTIRGIDFYNYFKKFK